MKAEANFIEERLGVEKGAVILDLACGPGPHAVELASRGYSVVGYDLSLAMLARAADEAQERGQKLNFLQGDMREMAFEETFDGVYCWSTSFGYFDDEKNQLVPQPHPPRAAQGRHAAARRHQPRLRHPRQPSLVWFEGDGCVCMDEMRVDFFTSRLRVKRTVMFEDGRTREIDYSIRLYALHELGKMLHDVGFKVIEVTGSRPPGRLLRLRVAAPHRARRKSLSARASRERVRVRVEKHGSSVSIRPTVEREEIARVLDDVGEHVRTKSVLDLDREELASLFEAAADNESYTLLVCPAEVPP